MTQAGDEVFILTTGPIEGLGGMERFLQYLASGFQERGYGVRVFHSENTGPERRRHSKPGSKLGLLLYSGLQGYYIGKAAREALHPGVRLVLSNSTVGWYGFDNSVKHAHFFHGTYRGQAEVIRPQIKYRGYLRMKWWDAMVLERYSGKNNIALCCSEMTRDEIRRYFGYDAHVMCYPIDLNHFRRLDTLECRRQLAIDSERVGLYVGSSHPMKGFGVVEEIARQFPELTMLVAVRGPVPDGARELPNIRVFQNAAYDVLPLLYNAADFSVCPSLYEPFGYVVAEALACGTPVIASPGGASLLFLRGDPMNRLLIANGNPVQGFLGAVREILRDPALYRRSVAENVRPKIEEMMAPANWWPRFQGAVGL